MKRILVSLVVALLIVSGVASAALDANSQPDDVLRALQASGQNIKSFSANVKLNEFDNGTEAETNRFGKVWFQIKPDGQPVMHILLDKKQVGDGKIRDDKIEYLLDDGWVTDRTTATTTESRLQLVPRGQKVDLFRLGKSPFPMPIGQDPDEIKKQFNVTRAAPANDDPPRTIHLILTPKPDSTMAQRFSKVEIWTDIKTSMPARIKTIDAKQAKERTADLTDLIVDPPLKPEDITLPALPPDWRTSDTPLR